MGDESKNQKVITRQEEGFIETNVRYVFDLDGKLFVFENVSARVHSVTGEQFFAPNTVRRIQQIALSTQPPAQTIQVGLYERGNAV